MRRFVLPSTGLTASEITIDGDTFHHMAKVLRLKSGSQVLLADGNGVERVGTIGCIGKNSLIVALAELLPPSCTPESPRITVYQGLPKGDKMEYVIQKATELGVAAIVPFAAARSVRKIRKEREDELAARWQRVAVEAARQSGRTSVPNITYSGSLAEALQGSHHSLRLLLWEKEQGARLRSTLLGINKPDEVAVIIGPEGGITSEEAAEATSCGFIPVSLGNRIVRTETASIVILSILQFLWGDMGSDHGLC